MGRVALVRGVAGYSHQTFLWTICRSVGCRSVQCIVEKRQIGSGCRCAPYIICHNALDSPTYARKNRPTVWTEVPLNWPNNVRGLRCNILETLHDTELVSTYRKPHKLYALCSDEVTFDTAWPWKVKDRFDLVRSAMSAQALFLFLCPALSYSALSWGTTKKWGHSKKIFGASHRNLYPHFWNSSGATGVIASLRRRGSADGTAPNFPKRRMVNRANNLL